MPSHLLDGQSTNRLVFIKVSLDHVAEWTQFLADPRTSLYWEAELEAPDVACKKWYDFQFYRHRENLGGMNALIEKATGRFVGHCGLLVMVIEGKKELEIGYSLLPEFWGKGYASEAAQKCKDYAFENKLSDSLISIISVPNMPSAAVANRIGMSIDKQVEYKSNLINIFRITREKWLENGKSKY